MKIVAPILLLVAGLTGILMLLPQPESSGPDANVTAFVNARVFDGTRSIEDATLVIADGRVQALGQGIEIPESAAVIDGSGKTVLPGLIDAHVHSFGPARADALRFGVTTVLDMFRPPFDFAQTRAARESLESTDRADLFSAGFLATVAGGHGTQYGIEVPVLSGPEEAPAWVAARRSEGSDWIKIIIEPGWGARELPTLDAITVAALVRAAHAQGLMAVAHVSSYADAMMAIEAGIDGLVHLFADRAVDSPFLEAARAAGIFVVPTTPVLAGMHGHDDTAWLDAHPRLGPRLTSAQRQGLAQRFPIPGQDTATWQLVETSIQALHEAGIAILAGSDAPNPGTAHGASMHHALRLLVGAGLSPEQALRAATSAPAKEFGLQDRGCLKPGCRADLLIVSGNPLAEIAATAQIDSIWKNGHQLEFERPAAAPAAKDTAPIANRGPVDLLAEKERWMAAADDFMGGQSEAAMAWTGEGEGTGLELKVTGRIAPGYPFPYAGAMWFASEIPMQATDYAGYRRLIVEIDGPKREYQALLFSGESQAVPPAQVPLDSAGSNAIELDSVAGLDLPQLRAIGVFAGGNPGTVDFTVRVLRLE